MHHHRAKRLVQGLHFDAQFVLKFGARAVFRCTKRLEVWCKHHPPLHQQNCAVLDKIYVIRKRNRSRTSAVNNSNLFEFEMNNFKSNSFKQQ